ncbi:MAG: hypothetical protein HY236_10030, partial [Acidobacteria bacterium]|nr:hypothetical protein [Acidobacteriota bacterium]
ADQLATDVRINRQTVVSHLEVEPLAYAVPFGRPKDCHPALPSILRREGICYALLATHGWNDGSVSPYRLHRDPVHASHSVDYLRSILHGCFDWRG